MTDRPELDVRLGGIQVGTVAHHDGQPHLLYTDEHIAASRVEPVSLSMPRRAVPQPARHWLDGLLPDSISVRRKWAARHGAQNATPAALLATPIGLDCAGAVQFAPAGDAWPDRRDSGVDWVEANEIAEWIARAQDDWDDWDGPRGNGQFSLGGAQAKCAVRFENGRWGLPFGDEATTHILKPGVAGLPDAAVVEHLCMETARLLGLDVARTSLMRFNGQRVLVVERYDRSINGAIRRLHQEDLCQSLGVEPAAKYQTFGGPSPAEIAEHLRAHSTAGMDDVQMFAEAVAYNWLIGAPDAHAKNYSVVLDDDDVWLAPLYDVISFVPYSSRPISEHLMAMSVDGDTAFGAADNSVYWRRFADAANLPAPVLLDSIGAMVLKAPAALRAAAAALPELDRGLRVVRDLLDGIAQRCGTLAAHVAPPKQSPSRLVQFSAATRKPVQRAVVCRHSERGRVCGRRLLTLPCPLHPNSPGSRDIRKRQTER